MRRPPEPSSLPEVSTVLEGLSDSLARLEDDLLASLVVMGESAPQRTVDGWVDQVADLLRAVDEVAAQHRTTLALAHSRAGTRGEPTPDISAVDATSTAADPRRTDRP